MRPRNPECQRRLASILQLDSQLPNKGCFYEAQSAHHRSVARQNNSTAARRGPGRSTRAGRSGSGNARRGGGEKPGRQIADRAGQPCAFCDALVLPQSLLAVTARWVSKQPRFCRRTLFNQRSAMELLFPVPLCLGDHEAGRNGRRAYFDASAFFLWVSPAPACTILASIPT